MRVCDSMNTLYLLVKETETIRLVGGTYMRRILRARLNGKARLVCNGGDMMNVKGTDVRL